MRQNPIERASGPTYQFMEAKWSVYPFDCVKDGEPQKKGGSDQLEAGRGVRR